jgi:protein-tyrosine phosphatase
MNISKITPHIYISSAKPFYDQTDDLKTEDIRYVVCCVKDFDKTLHREYIKNKSHNLKVLYLPLYDNTRQNLWMPSRDTTQYLYPVNDSTEELVRKWLVSSYNMPIIELAYHFINHAVEQGEKVLVHCMAGRSRSVSVVMYYLMRKHNIDSKEAYLLIRAKRQQASPNSAFMDQLRYYDHDRRKSEFDTFLNHPSTHKLNLKGKYHWL